MDYDKKEVYIDGELINLTQTEFSLLYVLLSNRGTIFSRQQLMEKVWGNVVVTDRTVDVNITRLRKKLGSFTPLIANKQGIGYYFDDKSEQISFNPK